MAQYPAMPLWTDAYLGDTHHLSTLEHGAYLLLLMSMWRAGGSLPADEKILARHCRLTAAQWRRASPQIMPFFTVKEGQIFQGRLTDELVAVRQKSKSQSSKAKARWLKNKETGDAAASSGHSQCNASLTHNPNPSVTNVTGDPPEDAPPDPVKILFDSGVALLAQGGMKPKQARSMIGKWRKSHSDEAILSALSRAKREGAIVPHEFIEKALRATGPPQSDWHGAFGKIPERN